ncbi:MAG: sensor domain-containing diguanylate cyclase [Clostridiales bacterium]|nr:sensor domain-containing diguanylate cyclase [Clostridiales bacterium]
MAVNDTRNAESLLEKIFYYMNQLMDEKDFEKAILLLTDLGRTLVGSDRASFWYWDTKKKQYWTIAAWGSEKITMPEGTGIVGAAIKEKESVIINNPYEDERFNPSVDKESGYITKSILCMPVTNEKGKVIGAFQAINKLDVNGLDGSFGEWDVKRLAMVAVFCGKTLESHMLQREAQIDQLTGLKNRRGFYEYYAEKMENTDSDRPMCIVICDIDFFKKVNDTYGHNAGDAVLIHVADVLHGNLRIGDEVVRWGGEEFVFLLQNKNLEEAAEFAEEVRKQIETTVCEYAGSRIKVTMSFGVEALNRDRDLAENIKRADDKLYIAKSFGRNRVVKQSGD